MSYTTKYITTTLLSCALSMSVLAAENPFISAYQTSDTPNLEIQQERINGIESFSFKSFDGEVVNGQIGYPNAKQDKYPVLIALHAMGRSFPRWWNAEINGRPTITKSNEITTIANEKGFAVIAADARFHGSRKSKELPLSKIITDLRAGDRAAYDKMITNTVKDYKLLLNWIAEQPQFEGMPVYTVGYSMGAQMALLLSAADDRISNVVSIVPPNVETTNAIVSPAKAAPFLQGKDVLLITANKDEYSTDSEFANLFDAISSNSKIRVVHDSGHILPAEYTEVLDFWYSKQLNVQNTHN